MKTFPLTTLGRVRAHTWARGILVNADMRTIESYRIRMKQILRNCPRSLDALQPHPAVAAKLWACPKCMVHLD